MLHLLTRYGSALTEPADESFVVCLEISATGGMPGWPRTSGQRILVERRGWFDDRRVAALRVDGNDVRQCTGPDPRGQGRTCPLVEEGRCRLAEDADRIVTLLPDDAECAAVIEAHRRLWPGKLAQPPTCPAPGAAQN